MLNLAVGCTNYCIPNWYAYTAYVLYVQFTSINYCCLRHDSLDLIWWDWQNCDSVDHDYDCWYCFCIPTNKNAEGSKCCLTLVIWTYCVTLLLCCMTGWLSRRTARWSWFRGRPLQEEKQAKLRQRLLRQVLGVHRRWGRAVRLPQRPRLLRT